MQATVGDILGNRLTKLALNAKIFYENVKTLTEAELVQMNKRTENKMTIDKVAELCGVSKTTVSRYLNGKYENMSAETKDRIQEVIKQVDYHPNRSAQRLKSSHSMLIGCVIGDISSPFSALLLKGITTVCEEAGYQVLFADSGEDAKRERRAIRGFLENRVDGLIINTSGNNDDFLLELQESGTPLVLADRQLLNSDRIDTVTTPSRSNAYDCVRFLYSQGYTRVAFFTERIGHITPRILRLEGYEQAVRDLAPEGVEPEAYEFTGDDMDSCKSYLRIFRRKYPKERIAVLSANGASAQKLLVACKEMGIEPGYDFGFCTFDDWNWLQISKPGITAVAQATGDVGTKSAELLLERIDGRRPYSARAVTVEIPSQFVIRESTPAQV